MVVRKRGAAASAVVVIVWPGINPHNTVGWYYTGSHSLEDNYWSPRCAFGHRLRLGLHEIQSPTWKDGTREELLISPSIVVYSIYRFFARIYTFSSSVVHEHETYSK